MRFLSIVVALALSSANTAWAYRPFVDRVVEAMEGQPAQVVAAGSLEIAFSPGAGAEALVIKVIGSARKEIRMLAYSFTSAQVVRALLDARHRGVGVQLVVDYKANLLEDRSGKARAALSALAISGVDVRVIDAFSIHHDKVICVDGETVELGSFNYSAAAANRNSENVLVNWHNPALVKVYLGHFERNFRLSKPFERER